MARLFLSKHVAPGDHSYVWAIGADGKALCMDLFDSKLTGSAFTAEDLTDNKRSLFKEV